MVKKSQVRSTQVSRTRAFLLVIALMILPTLGLAAQITEYPLPNSSAGLGGITSGPDGKLWFTENYLDKIGTISTTGQVTEFPIAAVNGDPSSIVLGADKNLWFTEYGGFIDDSFFDSGVSKINVSGTVAEYASPDDASYVNAIATGSDGNLWFTEVGHADPGTFSSGGIGRATPTGSLTNKNLVYKSPIYPNAITGGSDGALWFTEYQTACTNGVKCAPSGAAIGRFTTSGEVTTFPVPSANAIMRGITAGPDGNVWFTETLEDDNQQVISSRIGRITPAGVVTEFALPVSTADPMDITTGPDGDLWFTEFTGNQIGRITPTGSITEFALPTANSGPSGIALGPDKNIWFTEAAANQIGTLRINTSFAITPAISGSWYDPAQSGQGFNLEVVAATQIVAYFYTFDSSGNNLFLTGVGTCSGPNATILLYTTTGGFFQPYFDPTKITRAAWGTLFLNFTDCASGTAAWTPADGVSPLQAYVPGTMPISRITTIPGLSCP